MEFTAMNGLAQYRYIEQSSRVAAATPHALVAILLDEALDQIDVMQAALTRGRRHHEAQARATGVLHALETSLDYRSGGATALLMAQVYSEARRCLKHAGDEIDPNWCKQARATLAPIAEAWGQIA